MAVTASATGTQTSVISTEHQLADTALGGIYQFVVDTAAMVAGDTLELRVYQMVLTAGTSRVLHFGAFYGAQPTDDVIKTSVPVVNELTDGTALRFSLKQTAGSARAYPWKILKVAS